MRLSQPPLRTYIRETQKAEDKQVEVFMNSVPILQNLSVNEKIRLVDAFEQKAFEPKTLVIKEGDPGDLFYIIKEGEALVYQKTEQGEKKVNHLFKSDFFGERALLSNEPRTATVEAKTKLVCLTLDRKTFVEVLGPLEDIMNREKSPEVCTMGPHDGPTLTRYPQLTATKMLKLVGQGHPPHIPADVVIKNADNPKDVVRARGHLDEVLELKQVAGKAGEDDKGDKELVLLEHHVLGGGAFSRVSLVSGVVGLQRCCLCACATTLNHTNNSTQRSRPSVSMHSNACARSAWCSAQTTSFASRPSPSRWPSPFAYASTPRSRTRTTSTFCLTS